MKNIYFRALSPILCIILLTSCSPRFVTKGIIDTESNYIVTSDGKKVEANVIKIENTDGVTVDDKHYSLDELSAIKQKNQYYGVSEGKLYQGFIYGKVMVVGQVGFDLSYTPPTAGSPGGSSSHPRMFYFIQKAGQPEIVPLTGKNLVNYVEDNPDALRKARAAKIYSTLSIVSIFTGTVGLTTAILAKNIPLQGPIGFIGLISLPLGVLAIPIGNHKIHKAVQIYNSN